MSDTTDYAAVADTLVENHLEDAISEAQAAGDTARANELYQLQIGSTPPEDPPSTAVVEVDDPPQADTGEVVVATNADDEIVTVSGGMDFASNPEHVDHALACMEVWGEGEVAQLKSKWGSDLGANLGYFQSFALAHPDVHALLVDSGFGDHPAIIEAGAILGRAYVTKAGDPSRITTRKAGVQTMDNMATADIEGQIEAMQDQIDIAIGRNDHGRAQKLYTAQQELWRRLPGGTDPAVGTSGGRTA